MADVNKIIDSVGCIFAKTAKIEIMPTIQTFDYGLLRTHIKSLLERIVSFTQRVEKEQLDILMFELENIYYGKTLGNVCQTLFAILDEMSIHDPAEEYCMKEKIDAPDWSFKFNGVTFYIVVIAPCYPSSSSRYSYGSRSTFVVLQPAASFKRKHLPAETEISKETKNRIRNIFKSKGQEYDLSITLGDFECYRFVKPLHNGDSVVKWWEKSTWGTA